MKRILIVAALLLGLVGAGIAQRRPSKAAQKAEKREDKRQKEAVKEQRKEAKEVAKEIRKDGRPDMRYAENRRKAEEAARKERERLAREREKERERAAKATARAQRPIPPRVIHQPVNRSGDRIVGTDSKGRTIYEGARGGRYYINSHGNKEYVKQ